MKFNEINLESVYPDYKKIDCGFSVVLSEDDKVEFLIKHTSEKILLYIHIITGKFIRPPYLMKKNDSLPPFLDSVFLYYNEIMSILDIKKRQELVDEIVSKTIDVYSKKVFKDLNYEEHFKQYEHDFYTNRKFYIKKTEEGYKHFRFERCDIPDKKNQSIKPLNIKSIISKRHCEVCGCDISGRPLHHTLCYDCWKMNFQITNKQSENKATENINYDVEKFDQSDGYDDEWGYYNIHGEFPDWKK
jgi:hypothetical protein